MILLDSLYINNSGGKVLLDYLVKKIDENDLDAFYLFDNRCKNDFDYVSVSSKKFLKPSLTQRYNFYKKNKNKFDVILCFGNLAPPIKTKSTVYTYFHQRIYLDIPDSFSFKQKIAFKLKSLVFQYLLKNTDFVVLQTSNIKQAFLNKIKNIKHSKVLEIPFYEEMPLKKLEVNKNSFLYVSSGSPHKNHDLLLDAFKIFYNKYQKGKLIITIDKKHNYLINKIRKLIELGYPIENVGLISKIELEYYYNSSEFVIYPSLSESFGLGILEGLDTNCKIIGSDLPYLNAVCEPSLKFDPRSLEEIVNCFKLATFQDIKESKQKVFNEIDKLISLLKNPHHEN